MIVNLSEMLSSSRVQLSSLKIISSSTLEVNYQWWAHLSSRVQLSNVDSQLSLLNSHRWTLTIHQPIEMYVCKSWEINSFKNEFVIWWVMLNWELLNSHSSLARDELLSSMRLTLWDERSASSKTSCSTESANSQRVLTLIVQLRVVVELVGLTELAPNDSANQLTNTERGIS